MDKNIENNPWKGLDSYEEGNVLYGRDDDIRNFAQCVLNDSDTLFYGKSGIGKSSLLNAGILPIARRHGFLPIIIRLLHKKGQKTYMEQIKDSIFAAVDNYLKNSSKSDVCNEAADHREGIVEVIPAVDEKQEGMYEYFHRCAFYGVDGKRLKLLIIFDQFEEIFSLQENDNVKRKFFADLADMLNDIMPDYLQQKEVDTVAEKEKSEVGESECSIEDVFSDIDLSLDSRIPDYLDDNEIHFVFTIREDYLSEIEYYATSIPSLKQNRYGLRPLNEKQAAEVILNPCPGLVDEDVALFILQKITGKNNFKIDGAPEAEVDSTVLSLYLNRLYKAKMGDTITMQLVEQKDKEIIKEFYQEAIKGISDSSAIYLEDMLLTSNGKRDNIAVNDAKSDGNISDKELEFLCEEMKILRKFNHSGEQRIEFVHDILCDIVSQYKKEREDKEEMAVQQVKLNRLKRQRSLIFVVSGILLGFILLVYLGFYFPVSKRFASTTKVFGHVVGVEPLTKQEATYRLYHFVLKKNGLFTKRFTSMECRDGFGKYASIHSNRPYIVNNMDTAYIQKKLINKLKNVCKWEFIMDPLRKDKIMQERAYTENDVLVYALNYNSLINPEKVKASKQESYIPDKFNNGNKTALNNQATDKSVIGSYVDGLGLPLEFLKDTVKGGYRFVRISYDDKGHDMLVEYFDWDGNPSTNEDGAYQTYYEYNALGLCTSMSSLNMYGKRMIDRAGNCGQVAKYDGYNLVEIISVDEFGREIAVKEGYSRAKHEYDIHGRKISTSIWKFDEPAKLGSFHRMEMKYADKLSYEAIKYGIEDELVSHEIAKFDSKGNQLKYSLENAVKKTDYYRSFDADNNLIYQKVLDIIGSDTLVSKEYTKEQNKEIYNQKDSIREIYTEVLYDAKGREIEYVYLEKDVLSQLLVDSVRSEHYYFRGRKKMDPNSPTYKEIDSAVYKSGDMVNANVISLMPNINLREHKRYENNKLQYTVHSVIDSYANEVEKYIDLKIYTLINPKTNESSGTLRYMTRYKYPTIDFHFNDFNKNEIRCDENGVVISNEATVYELPAIYTDESQYPVNFIEIVKEGRHWHAVILQSSCGYEFGDGKFTPKNFSYDSKISCLNLTSMRIEEFDLETDKHYWIIYQCYVTRQLYDIFNEYYDQCKGTLPLLIGSVADTSGFLGDKELHGEYIIMQWANWNCTQAIKWFEEEFEKSKEEIKNIVLVKIPEEGEMSAPELIHMECPGNTFLGFKISEQTPSTEVEEFYNKYAKVKYLEWKNRF